MSVLFRRQDGTFVIDHNGYPYHVVPGDPLGDQFSPEEIAAALLDPELPVMTPPPAPPEPTKAELLQQLQALAAKIEALP